MDSACNKITNATGTVVAPGSATTRVALLGAIILTPGVYYVGWTSTVATDKFFGVPGDFAGDTSNIGFVSPNLSYFKGTNASVAGVLPATCGAMTAVNGQSLPFIRFTF